MQSFLLVLSLLPPSFLSPPSLLFSLLPPSFSLSSLPPSLFFHSSFSLSLSHLSTYLFSSFFFSPSLSSLISISLSLSSPNHPNTHSYDCISTWVLKSSDTNCPLCHTSFTTIIKRREGGEEEEERVCASAKEVDGSDVNIENLDHSFCLVRECFFK